jgi:hypothetical protein
LLADPALQAIDLELAREPREIAGQQQPAFEAVQRLEQRGREATRRAEPGAGRNVGERRDLVLRFGDAHHRECFADERMLDVFEARDLFDLGVLEEHAGPERAVDRDPHVLVDRGREQEAAVVLVIRRQIGAAAAERDAQRAACDQHEARVIVGTAGTLARL